MLLVHLFLIETLSLKVLLELLVHHHLLLKILRLLPHHVTRVFLLNVSLRFYHLNWQILLINIILTIFFIKSHRMMSISRYLLLLLLLLLHCYPKKININLYLLLLIIINRLLPKKIWLNWLWELWIPKKPRV